VVVLAMQMCFEPVMEVISLRPPHETMRSDSGFNVGCIWHKDIVPMQTVHVSGMYSRLVASRDLKCPQ
jgi:hypothetical protein